MKLNAKTQFFLITFDFCIHSKKVVKFSFKRQKIFWVLVFSFMYLVLVDAMDRSIESIQIFF